MRQITGATERIRAAAPVLPLSQAEPEHDIRRLQHTLELTRHVEVAGGNGFSDWVGSHARVRPVVLECDVLEQQRAVEEETSVAVQGALLLVPADCWLRDTCWERTQSRHPTINHSAQTEYLELMGSVRSQKHLFIAQINRVD